MGEIKESKDINQTVSASEHTVSSEASKFHLFQSIPEMVKKYGMGTMFFSVLILFLVLNLIINPINFELILEKWFEKTEMQHRLSIEKRHQAELVIPNLLSNLLLKTNADRVMLLELHNGTSNINGVPFLFFTASFEVINDEKPELEYVADQYSHQRTSDYSEVFDHLRKARCVYYADIDSAKDGKMIRRLKKNGVKSIHMNPIFDNTGRFCGVLTLTSNLPNTLDHSKIQYVAVQYSQQLGQLLSN